MSGDRPVPRPAALESIDAAIDRAVLGRDLAEAATRVHLEGQGAYAEAAAPADDQAPEPTAPLGSLQAFLDGEEVDLEALRADVRGVLAQAQAMYAAYREASDLAGAMGQQARGMADALFGEWHPDPFVRGMLHGEGYAWMRLHAAMGTLLHGMRMRELAEVKDG